MMLGRTLLIIDDNDDWCLAAARYFSRENYRTYATAACGEGIALAERLCPEFVMLDYHLKDGNALRVASHIRKSGRLAQTILLVTSGDIAMREAAYDDCQADYFLHKGPDFSFGTMHKIFRSIERRIRRDRDIVEKGDLCLEGITLQVFLDSKPAFQLSRERFSLLSLLVAKSPAFLTELDMAAHIYGPEAASEKSPAVKVLLHRLRGDLGPIAGRIQNRRNLGWAYVPAALEKTEPR